MLWTFVEACFRGQLGFSECGPAYQLAIIGILLVVAIVVLARLVLRRIMDRGGTPE